MGNNSSSDSRQVATVAVCRTWLFGASERAECYHACGEKAPHRNSSGSAGREALEVSVSSVAHGPETLHGWGYDAVGGPPASLALFAACVESMDYPKSSCCGRLAHAGFGINQGRLAATSSLWAQSLRDPDRPGLAKGRNGWSLSRLTSSRWPYCISNPY